MYARIPGALAVLLLFLLAGATNSQAAPSAADRVNGVTLAQGPSERAEAVSGVAPVLIAPTPMSVPQGTAADQLLQATDGDGDPITFSKSFGPAYMTVTTVDPGSGSATGNVHLAPSLADQGVMHGGISVSDGTHVSAATLEITVTGPNRPPILDQPSPMSGRAGQIINQVVTAADPDGDPLSFSKVSGPAYMSVQTLEASPSGAMGLVRLSPTGADSGSTTGTVAASDGRLVDQKSFSITIQDSAPVLTQPADMTLLLGEAGEQTVTATDSNGDSIVISKVSGPAYVTVSGFGKEMATGTIRATPGVGDEGLANVTIQASDDQLYDTKSFTVNALARDFPPPCGAGAFFPLATSFGFGWNVQTADLNGDAVLDLVAEIPGYPVVPAGWVVVALGAGDGTFGASTYLIADRKPVSGAIADFNGDGALDIAISNWTTENVCVYLGDGAGGFGPKHDFRVNLLPGSIIAADVNRDGKMDLMTANLSTKDVSLLQGVGDGTFLTAVSIYRPYLPGFSPSDLAAPDLNGDGAPDLVVVNVDHGDITVFLNNGSGDYGSGTDYPVGNSPSKVAAGDLNEDGKVDIVVTSAGSNYVSVFLGGGNGTLGPRRNFTTGAGPGRIAILDVNGDNHLDLAISNREFSVSVLLGDGSGVFGSRTEVPVGGATSGIASGDFDGDLRSDLAVANTILLNRCAPPRDLPPVVTAPKGVSGAEGSGITFTISANDPDGPAISSLTADFSGLPVGNKATFTPGASDTGGVFRWTPGFEDSRPEPYSVTFTAANVLSASSTTKITVTDASVVTVCQARAFTADGKGGIRLGGGKEHRCVSIEPVGGSFRLGTVDVTSIVMKSHNTGSVEEIRASEVAVGGDRDRNGVEEIAACFRKEDLRLLFGNLRGNSPVTITLEGRLSTGEIFRAQVDVLVNAGGGKLAALVSPNPLNPEAILTFVTTERGPLRVRLFDLNGRMIRSLLEESDASVGYHDVRIDGRDEHGGRLASGVYFVRGTTPDGIFKNTITILK